MQKVLIKGIGMVEVRQKNRDLLKKHGLLNLLEDDAPVIAVDDEQNSVDNKRKKTNTAK